MANITPYFLRVYKDFFDFVFGSDIKNKKYVYNAK